MEDIAEMITQLRSLVFKLPPSGHVGDERRSKEILSPEGKGTGVLVDGPDTLRGISLEHEYRVIESRRPADGGGEHVVCLLLGRDIVALEIDGETGIGESYLLAWWRGRSNISPSSKVSVASSDRVSGQRADIMEWFGVNLVDLLHSFLNNVEEDNGLSAVRTKVTTPCTFGQTGEYKYLRCSGPR